MIKVGFYSVKYEEYSEWEQGFLGLVDFFELLNAVFVEVELLTLDGVVASYVTFLGDAQEGTDALAVVAESFDECVSLWLTGFFHFNNYKI